MNPVLALKYRPRRFAEVVGQGHVKPILQAMVREDRVPPALLFSGTRGTGKTTCARVFAAALNCLQPQDGDACGACAICQAVQRGNCGSVLEIDAASNGGVEEVRRITDLCLFGHEGNYRVILLDEAHSMSTAAYHALLKLLEEPPEHTCFVLVTTEPEKILETVRSRTMPFEFRRIRTGDLQDRLRSVAQSENLAGDDGLFSEISQKAQGSLRDSLMIFDQVSRVGVSTAEDFRAFFGFKDYAVPMMWAALRGDHAEGHRLVLEHFNRTGEASGMVTDLTRLVSDLLVIKSESRPVDRTEEELAERVEMASAVTTDSLVKAIEILWDLKARTRATENDQRASMEMGFALIAHAVKPAEPLPAFVPLGAGERMTLDQIRNYGT